MAVQTITFSNDITSIMLAMRTLTYELEKIVASSMINKSQEVIKPQEVIKSLEVIKPLEIKLPIPSMTLKINKQPPILPLVLPITHNPIPNPIQIRYEKLESFMRDNVLYGEQENIQATALMDHFNTISNLFETPISFSRLMKEYMLNNPDKNIRKTQATRNARSATYYFGLTINK